MDAALGFYGVHLSDNMVETPEGYLVCKNAVIARTGTQTYRFHQLPQEEAEELGLQGNPDDEIDLHRDPVDVFDPEFIASLEGKSVTDQHPSELLTLDSVRDHEQGTIHNVRPGDEPLESGDMPLLADLLIKSKALIAKIHGGLRELSCGYTFHIAKDGERVLQVGMTGNHVALVHAGRAGHEARVYDHRDPPKEKVMAKKLSEMTLKERIAHVFGLGIKQMGADAEPGELAAAAVALDAAHRSADARRSGKRGARGLDADRQAFHKLIDEMCDASESEEEEGAKKMKDAQRELAKMLGARADDASEEEEEEAEVGDEDDEEEDGEEAEDSEEEDGEEAADGSLDDEDKELGYEAILPVGDRPKPAAPGLDGKRKKAKDGKAGMDSAEAFLKLIRPAIARSKDKKLRAGFDAALKQVSGRSRTRQAGSGYGAAARAAGSAKGTDAAPGTPSDAELTKLYAERKTAKRAAYK